MKDTVDRVGRSRLTLEERTALQGWLKADRILMDSDATEYFVREAEKRGQTFGSLLSAILLAVSDDEMVGAILED